MLINRQVPVLNLTDIKNYITRRSTGCIQFSLCLLPWWKRRYPRSTHQVTNYQIAIHKDKEVDPQLHTSEAERQYGMIKGSTQATQAALSHPRVQMNPTVERGPPWRPKTKKLPRDKAAEKGTQTKNKEKQT